MTSFTFMSGQEGAVRTMLEAAVKITQGRGERVGPVPENSPVGESQSNGYAEAAVTALIFQARTLTTALAGNRKMASLIP